MTSAKGGSHNRRGKKGKRQHNKRRQAKYKQALSRSEQKRLKDRR